MLINYNARKLFSLLKLSFKQASHSFLAIQKNRIVSIDTQRLPPKSKEISAYADMTTEYGTFPVKSLFCF